MPGILCRLRSLTLGSLHERATDASYSIAPADIEKLNVASNINYKFAHIWGDEGREMIQFLHTI